jgi:hypothetical protein
VFNKMRVYIYLQLLCSDLQRSVSLFNKIYAFSSYSLRSYVARCLVLPDSATLIFI